MGFAKSSTHPTFPVSYDQNFEIDDQAMSARLAANRQRELKQRAGWHVGRRPQPPAMGLDDRAADRQPHAEALGLGRIEGIEELLQAGRIKPRTGVLY